MKKKKQKGYDLIIIAVIVLLIGLAAGFYFGLYHKECGYDKEFPRKIDLEPAADFIEVEPSMFSNVLSLSSECYVLSFQITEDQAFSIQRGIEEQINFRPLTHDLVKDVLENYGISVIYAQIDRVDQEGIYYATIFIRDAESVLEIDARPSDATALSVRAGTPIYVKRDILRDYGEEIC